MPELSKLIKFNERDYRVFFAGTPIRRLGYYRFMRNVLIAIGNSNEKSFIKEVKEKINNENELVKAMAIWALYCLDRKEFYYLKDKTLKYETSSYIRKEWMQGESFSDSM